MQVSMIDIVWSCQARTSKQAKCCNRDSCDLHYLYSLNYGSTADAVETGKGALLDRVCGPGEATDGGLDA